MARCHPTQRGVKETSRSGLKYEARGCQVPSMGPQMSQMLVTICVALSLTLVALGDSNLASGFHLRTLSVASLSAIVGPVLDTVVVSHDI
jgi:hypothetical protein